MRAMCGEIDRERSGGDGGNGFTNEETKTNEDERRAARAALRAGRIERRMSIEARLAFLVRASIDIRLSIRLAGRSAGDAVGLC
jgi:hypothetical protein